MTLNSSITLSGTGKFSGDGSLLTNIPYSIITGKPSFFQTDWNTTISNKPSTFPVDTTVFYNKTEVNNLLNAKQANLTAATTLLGVGSSIKDIDYNKITINKPSTFPVDTTVYYNKTEVNNLLNAKQANLTAATTLLGIGSSITDIDYNKITINKP
jgi:hypothetical protein